MTWAYENILKFTDKRIAQLHSETIFHLTDGENPKF